MQTLSDAVVVSTGDGLHAASNHHDQHPAVVWLEFDR